MRAHSNPPSQNTLTTAANLAALISASDDS